MGTISLEMLHNQIESVLFQIEKLLPSEYKLTLVARHTKNDNSHILLTVDDTAKVIDAINILNKTAVEKQDDLTTGNSTPPAAPPQGEIKPDCGNCLAASQCTYIGFPSNSCGYSARV